MKPPVVLMAKLLIDVMPPAAIATGTRQLLSRPKTINQMIQPETVPVLAVFMIFLFEI
jgi:hypothetical protein